MDPKPDPNDKLSKVRPLLEHLRSKFKEIPMTEYLCVDEQMVPFKGNSSMKQYIPKKPHKRGYKIFVLADDIGMVYDFMLDVDHLASRGIWCSGTVPQNRLQSLTFKSDKQLQAYGCGSHDEWETVYEDGNKITALKWFGNKAVHLVSTFATSFPFDKCTRFNRKMKEKVEVARPFIVKDYNTYMGGVDQKNITKG
ncbi:piggyBac transposable element-derived protein 3-like [Penaeus chinensis]|uniref:piggyBac transposable element-derived protein 3-like n=1 Tax=Penaeus chinensis TaxID=139456 RepID=UPI001FB709E1|nr:piggyBac transposable element-derived protein 3-like [Penaeus chinensis]